MGPKGGRGLAREGTSIREHQSCAQAMHPPPELISSTCTPQIAIVLEYMDGGSLADIVQKVGTGGARREDQREAQK